MYTRCPACESWFLLRAVHLRAAGGQVRCGRCGHGFNALDHLADEPPPEPGPEEGLPPALTLTLATPGTAPAGTATLVERAAGTGPAAPTSATGPAEAEPAPAGTEEPAADEFVLLEPEATEEPPTLFGPDETVPAAETAPEETDTASAGAGTASGETAPQAPPESADTATPPFLESADTGTDPARRRWPWAAAAAVLALTLAGQLAYAWRGELAEHPALRPWVERVCARLGCAVPVWREPAAFVVRERALVAHPGRKGALLFTATILNSAGRAQPPPVLELRLSTLEGRLLGVRRFRPAEYVPGAPPERVAPGGTLSVRLELKDPGGAESFQIRFL